MKAWLASVLLRTLARTWRIRVHGTLPHQPCVVAFWHGEMLPVWYLFRALRPTAVVSMSKDGQLLSNLLKEWGYTVVRGSSSRGGSEVLAEIASRASHDVVLLTPDGPRGPARVAKPGCVVAAHRANVPLVLVRITAGTRYVFSRSWDRFQLPAPFSRITVHVASPIVVDAKATRQEVDDVVLRVTAQLNALGSVVC